MLTWRLLDAAVVTHERGFCFPLMKRGKVPEPGACP